jgi:hypothetical protein
MIGQLPAETVLVHPNSDDSVWAFWPSPSCSRKPDLPKQRQMRHAARYCNGQPDYEHAFQKSCLPRNLPARVLLRAEAESRGPPMKMIQSISVFVLLSISHPS